MSTAALPLLAALLAAAALPLGAGAPPRPPPTLPPLRASSGGATIPGFIYALSNNGSTNELNFLAADLDTFEILPRGGPIADAEAIGQAALVLGSTFFSMLLVRDPADPAKDAVVLAGFDTASGARVASFDTRAWPGAAPAGRGVFIEALFASGAASMLVVGRNLGEQAQLLLDVDAASGAATLRGSVNCSGGGDLTWDPSHELLFETVTDGNDEDSGSLVLVNTSAAAPPGVVGSFALADHFGFSLFDAATDSLLGLSLRAGGPNGYLRELLSLSADARSFANATSHGDLGALYVVLEDGPKALDAATRRAFFMLASGPFAEFEIVAVDVDAVPVKVLETPGLCGFIGYCPQAFAYGPAS